MSFNFERFTKTGSSFAPMISIRKHGAIGLSQGALQRFGLMEGEWFVVLYFDKAANVLGIQPVKDENEDGAIKLIKRRAMGKNGKSSISSSVSAKSFFEYYQIPTAETRSFRGLYDDATKMIIVNLNEPEKTEKDEDQSESE